MADQYGKIELIVNAIRDELVTATDELPWVTASNVIISDEPNFATPVPSDRWIVVSPSPQAQYDPAALGGGGQWQATVRTRVIVTIHHGADIRDEPDRIDQFFSNSSRSINIDARAVIKVLVSKGNWEMPYDPDAPPSPSDPPIYLMNDPILPAETNFAKAKSGGSVQIGFDIEYDEYL